MRLRRFFILLFIAGVGVSAFYTFRFFTNHYISSGHVDLRFIMLVALAIVLQLFAHLLRAYKSKFLLDRIRPARTITLFKGLSVGYLFNSLLPLRLGEFIRAFYVGDNLSISKTTVFMSIIIERLVDGFILGVSFLSAGLLVHHTSHFAFEAITKLGVGLLVATTVLMLVIHVLLSENRILLRTIHSTTSIFNAHISNRLRFMAWSGIYGTRLMLADRRSRYNYYLASVVMWIIYFCSTALVIVAFFDIKTFHDSWYTIQSSYASTSTPAGPGYIGTFQLILSRLLEKISISSINGFAIFDWLIITAPISLIGIFVLIRQRFGNKQDVSRQDALINKLYREKDISTEFSNFLDAYFDGEEINRILTQAELDEKFKLVKSFKGGSNAHTMLVWQDQTLFVKKITLPQFGDKLQAQAQWLIEREGLPHLPKIVREDTTPNYYSFDLTYHEDFFPFFDYIHSHSVQASYDVLRSMLDFMTKSIYEPRPVNEGEKNVRNYIETKALGKVNDTAAISNQISQLLTQPTLQINGKRYDNMLRIVEKIKTNKQAMADLSSYQESPIHGDLTIDNLIASSKGNFLVIDPNDENQVSAAVVDYGKLYQSLHSGYEFLIQLDSCKLQKNTVNFEDSKSQKYAELFVLLDQHLKKTLSGKDYRSILFHEAIHYCRMLTYRANINPLTLPVFYATAVRLFNEFLDQYDP